MDSYIPLHLHAPLPKPPLDPATLSPHLNVQHLATSHSPPIDQVSQAEAVSMRRKKNADAQAAFRLRRANYIASLEETVTSLEAVVLSLQDTCREVRNDAEDLRPENARLQSTIECVKQAARERERQWREFWQSKQQALGLDDILLNEMPPIPPIFQTVQAHNTRQCTNEASRYQNGAASQQHSQHHLDPYVPAPPREIDQRYATSHQPYTTSPENTWPPGPFPNSRTPCLGDTHPSHSSSSSDSPQSLSPNIHYMSRFPVSDETRVSLVNVNIQEATYDSSTFVPENYSPEGYQNTRHMSDSERYAPRPRRSYSQSRTGDFYSTEITRGESEGIHGEGNLNDLGRARHHGRVPSDSLGHGGASHSPSSSPPPRDREHDREPPISNTLAMIKAQAFGSLRRTRHKTKKGAEAASKVAVDVLNARGIGMGVQQPSNARLGSKRKAEELESMTPHS